MPHANKADSDIPRHDGETPLSRRARVLGRGSSKFMSKGKGKGKGEGHRAERRAARKAAGKAGGAS